MFAEVEFEWTVLVEPDAMKSGAHIQRAVILALLKDFNDKKCTPQHGYHVAITTLESIGEGRLWELRACAAFPVRFRCIVFNVFKSEHVVAVVTEALSNGIMSRCGCIDQLFISSKYLKDYEVLSTDVDGLKVTMWRNSVDGKSIKKGDVIRVKILGSNWEPSVRGLSAAGSLLGDYAGKDDRWQKVTSRGDFGSDSPRQVVGTDDSLWGEPLPKEDDNEASGWGDPLPMEEEEPSGWA
ncbi:unnamed protein product [Calypogeia fissa]